MLMAKYVVVRIEEGSTCVDIGRDTHSFIFRPTVFSIVPIKTPDSENPDTAFWWDMLAPDDRDGGDSVRISCGKPPSRAPYVVGVLIGRE